MTAILRPNFLWLYVRLQPRVQPGCAVQQEPPKTEQPAATIGLLSLIARARPRACEVLTVKFLRGKRALTQTHAHTRTH